MDLKAPEDLTSSEARCAPGQPAGLCAGQPCESGCRCIQLYRDGGIPGAAACDCSTPTATNPAPADYLCCDGVWCQGVGSMEPYCDQANVGPGCYPGFTGG